MLNHCWNTEYFTVVIETSQLHISPGYLIMRQDSGDKSQRIYTSLYLYMAIEHVIICLPD